MYIFNYSIMIRIYLDIIFISIYCMSNLFRIYMSYDARKKLSLLWKLRVQRTSLAFRSGNLAFPRKYWLYPSVTVTKDIYLLFIALLVHDGLWIDISSKECRLKLKSSSQCLVLILFDFQNCTIKLLLNLTIHCWVW